MITITEEGERNTMREWRSVMMSMVRMSIALMLCFCALFGNPLFVEGAAQAQSVFHLEDLDIGHMSPSEMQAIAKGEGTEPQRSEDAQHTVAFVNWDGQPLATFTAKDGADIAPLAAEVTATRPGYAFLRWQPSVEDAAAHEDIAYRAVYDTRVCELIIEYRFPDGTVASKPHMATLSYGEAYSVASPTVLGYTPEAGKDVVAGTAKGSDGVISVTVWYEPEEGTPYHVIHSFENLDGGYDDAPARLLSSRTGARVAVTPLAREGFAPASDVTEYEIAADGTTEIFLQYDRTLHTIAFETIGGTRIEPIAAKYGAAVAPPKEPERQGYAFAGWDMEGLSEFPEEMPARDYVFTALWEPALVRYRVMHWWQTQEGVDAEGNKAYALYAETGEEAPCGSVVSADDVPRSHVEGDQGLRVYTHGSEDVTIEPDGSAIVNLYYDRPVCEYVFWAYNAQEGAYMPMDSIQGLYGAYVPYWPWREQAEAYYLEHGGEPIAINFGGWSQTRYPVPYTDTAISMFAPQERFFQKVPTVDGRKIIDLYALHWNPSGALYEKFVYSYKQVLPEEEGAATLTRGGKHYKLGLSAGIYNYLNTATTVGNILYGKFSGLGVYGYEHWYYCRDAATGAIYLPDAPLSQAWRENAQAYGSYGSYTQARLYGGEDKSLFGRMNVFYDLIPYRIDFHNGRGNVIRTVEPVYYEQTMGGMAAGLEKYAPGDPPDGVHPDSVFEGWYYTPDFLEGTQVDWNAKNLVTGNLKVYAKWRQPTHSVTFDTGFEEPKAPEAQAVSHNAHATDPGRMAREGYDFAYWYVEENVPFSFSNAKIKKDTLLTAKWEPRQDIDYVVRYEAEDAPGVDLMEPKRVTGQVMASTVTESAPSIEGYLPLSAGGILLLGAADNVMTLTYKEFAPTDYTVRCVEESGGELAEPRTVTAYENRVAESAPVIPGYVAKQGYLELALTANVNVITFSYVENPSASYTVRHYRQNAPGGGYTLLENETQTGPAGKRVFLSDVRKTFEGYALNEDNSTAAQFIMPDGTMEMHVYYDLIIRASATVSRITRDYRGSSHFVPGAKLEIWTTGDDAEKVYAFTSGAEAEVLADILIQGVEYELREVKAPKGFQPALPVVFTTGKAAAQVDMASEPTLVILEKRNEDGQMLPSAHLEIQDEEGNAVWDGIAQGLSQIFSWEDTRLLSFAGELPTDGAMMLEGILEAGKTYWLVEIGAPDTYRQAEPVAFTVSSDGKPVTVVMINEKKQKVSVRAATPEGGVEALLPGAVLGLYADGTLVEEWNTGDKNPRELWGFAPKVSYEVREVVPPSGYLSPIEAPIAFTLADLDEEETRAFTLTYHPTQLIVDAKQREWVMGGAHSQGAHYEPGASSLAGVVLEILDESKTPVRRFTSDGQPHIALGLEAEKEHWLQQADVPEGYILSQKAIGFVIHADGQLESLGEAEAERMGTGGSLAPIPGPAPLEGYPESSAAPRIDMPCEPAALRIEKIDDETGDWLEGATLELYKGEVSAENLALRFVTVAKPQSIPYEALELGQDYVLHEAVAPMGYFPAEDVSFVFQTPGESVVTRGSPTVVELKAVGKTGTQERIPLPGTEFAVFAARSETDPAKALYTFTTDDAVQVLLPGGHDDVSWTGGPATAVLHGLLEAGKTYYVRQMDRPAGYLAAGPWSFTVDAAYVGLELESEAIPMIDLPVTMVWDDLGFTQSHPRVSLELHCAGSTDNPIRSHTLQPEDSLRFVFDDLPACDAEGNLYEYFLSEAAVARYASEITYRGEEGFVITHTFIPPKTVEVAKVRQGGDLVGGAQIGLYLGDTPVGLPSGEPLEVWLAVGSGPHTIQCSLEDGQAYTLHELSAPDGYHYMKNFTFTTDDTDRRSNGNSVYYDDERNTIVVTLFDPATYLSVVKFDAETGQPLRGATLAILDSMGREIEAWVTNEDPHEVYGKLAAGAAYTLVERGAPDGYAIADPLTFHMPETHPYFAVAGSLPISPMSGGLPPSVYVSAPGERAYSFLMVDDETGDPLAGARLSVRDQAGNVAVPEWTSAETAHVVRGTLKQGQTYLLVEGSAPEGYDMAADVEFTIGAEGLAGPVVMRSRKAAVLEPTPTVTAAPTEAAMVAETATAREVGTPTATAMPTEGETLAETATPTETPAPTASPAIPLQVGSETPTPAPPEETRRIQDTGNALGALSAHSLDKQEAPARLTTPTVAAVRSARRAARRPVGMRSMDGQWMYIDEYDAPLCAMPLAKDDSLRLVGMGAVVVLAVCAGMVGVDVIRYVKRRRRRRRRMKMMAFRAW